MFFSHVSLVFKVNFGNNKYKSKAMNLSDNDSGSSSEEDYNVVKVINNARVPEEFEELTGESSQEEANVEEEVFAESEAEVVAESEAEVDEESETDAESEAETAVVTDKEVKQVEPKITKTVPNKKNVYRDIILACFNHYANETISLSKIKSYAHTEHDISDHQQTFLKKALKKLIDEEIVKNQKGKSQKSFINLD